jgi:hypothetical protein
MQKLGVFIASVFAAGAIMPAIGAAQRNDLKSGVMPPPMVISIGLEQIKHGKVSAHEKNEMAWIQALIQAKYHEFLALDALTGPSEIMWLIPFPSYAAYEANFKLSSAAGAFHSIAMRYSVAEADDVSGKTEMLATYREDLSYCTPINIGEYRYMTMATTRVRPGHNSDYFELLKTINEARKSTNSDEHVAVYEVTSGAPTGTFLTFTPRKSLAEMDSANPAMTQATADARQRIDGLVEKAVVVTSTTMYAFNPKISNPTEQMAAVDPAFWKPKVATAKAPSRESTTKPLASKKQNQP